MERALHLVQLFTASGVKNGADIRLAVDAVEDLMRHPEISHVVVVAGDSDYVPLAQSCKQLGRYVVGTFTSVKDLINAIETFIDGWNDRCEPFMWTKTADELLAKAKPRQKTSNTRH
jgi:uncharacterized LabA/DUF88 family protein